MNEYLFYLFFMAQVLERPVQLQALIPEEPKAPCAREEVVLPPPKGT
jgi:hypothetical protein